MNLNSVVAPFTAVINPRELITIYPSTGYTTNADGTRNPATGTPVTLLAQIQQESHSQLNQSNGINLQGNSLAAYLPGNWSGIVRASQTGGDRMARADGSIWLITAVDENWDSGGGWTKITATRQLN